MHQCKTTTRSRSLPTPFQLRRQCLSFFIHYLQIWAKRSKYYGIRMNSPSILLSGALVLEIPVRFFLCTKLSPLLILFAFKFRSGAVELQFMMPPSEFVSLSVPSFLSQPQNRCLHRNHRSCPPRSYSSLLSFPTLFLNDCLILVTHQCSRYQYSFLFIVYCGQPDHI